LSFSDKNGKTLSQSFISRGSLFSRAKTIYDRNGLSYLIRISFRYLSELFFVSIPNYIKLSYYKKFKAAETFKFNGREYHYLFHPYCATWENERCAVIPIIWDIVRKNEEEGKRILEVGNVLSYVYPVRHDVLDKYELVEGVINEDVVNFQPPHKYDLIISIVTIQFVGWNESPREPRKVLQAIDNLKSILAPNGILVVVHGLGEHKEIDELFKNGLMKFDKQFYLMKTAGHKWKEATWEDVKDLKYNHSVPTANGVVVGVIGPA